MLCLCVAGAWSPEVRGAGLDYLTGMVSRVVISSDAMLQKLPRVPSLGSFRIGNEGPSPALTAWRWK